MCRFDGICIDSFSLSVVLQSCGRLVDSENGESLHAYCLKHGFGSDLFVQTALIEMYGRFGLVDVSRKVFDEIKDPDCISCNVMLGEYVRVREMGLAEEFFDKISDRDLVSWNTMIHGYASIGDIESAQDLFDTSTNDCKNDGSCNGSNGSNRSNSLEENGSSGSDGSNSLKQSNGSDESSG
ncbi:hypothetical protein ACET3Z_001952 [Daucus carota]